MSLTIELACTKSGMAWEKNPNASYPNQTSYVLSGLDDDGQQRVYLAFETLPGNLRNYAIKKAYVRIPIGTAYRHPSVVVLYYLSSDFPAAITWASRQDGFSTYGTDYELDFTSNLTYYLCPSYNSSSYPIAKWATNPWFYIRSYERHDLNYDGPWAALASQAKLLIEYDTAITVTSTLDMSGAPKNRYVNPRSALTVSWALKSSNSNYASANSAFGFTQASASLYWRAGTSGSYSEIPVSGSETSVTIPANTLPTGSTIQYYVEATDTLGTTSTSDVYQFSTTDAAISATPVSPISNVEDGSGPIAFRWTISSPNGTTPTRIDLQWKLSTDSAWQSVNNLAGTAAQYTFGAGTFPAGEIQWRVRAYNADGVAGSWSSQSTSFVCVAAPSAPSVSTDAAPFATITWQVDGQQAFRITVDGTVYGPHFGTAKSFTLPDYLTDGQHTASVEVQGTYGLWSQPGTILFTVANIPGDAVELQAAFGVDAALSWQTASATADFLIYRDGVRIGHTGANSFTDRLVLGTHSYAVVNRLPSGHYSISNAVTGTLRSCTTRIAPAAGGDWLPLRLSENSMDEQRFTYTRGFSLRHVSGAEYPVLELSPFLDASGRYNTAFSTVEQAQAFEALKGRVVIVKSRGGNVIIGALTDLQKRNAEFYIAYDFTIQCCHWEDNVDVPDG